MSASRRRAFTLLELLVVIGIIGLLIGLLLPAVQKVRAAAAQAGCKNNLKQIGLALHLYHDQVGTLPAGVTSAKVGEPFAYMGWLTRLLPYIEQDSLWRVTQQAYDYVPHNPFRLPHEGFFTPITLFACPADGRPLSAQSTHQGLRVALSSYLGVSGIDLRDNRGVLFVDSRVRLTEVLDGTSNTLAVGERPPSPDFWYGWWYAAAGQGLVGSADTVLGVREIRWPNANYAQDCPPGPYTFWDGRLTEQCDLFHFWSTHSNGANFLFADGSVRYLPYSAETRCSRLSRPEPEEKSSKPRDADSVSVYPSGCTR